jgi:hypothetical protein
MGFKSFVLFFVGWAAVALSTTRPWFGTHCDISPVEVIVSALHHDSRARPAVTWLLNNGLHHIVRPAISTVDQFVVKTQSRELLLFGSGLVVFSVLALWLLRWGASFTALIAGGVMVYMYLQANHAMDCALEGGLPMFIIGGVFLLCSAFIGRNERRAAYERRRHAKHD